MTGFSRSPRVAKGALVGLDPLNPLAGLVVFQYNPETLERTVRARGAGQDADRAEVLRLAGPPEETISLEIELDATDKLEAGDVIAGATGIAPQLAALEILLTPKTAIAIANEALAAVGTIEVLPMSAPLTLFAWGAKRVVPVRLTELTITEQAFDPALNPIQARARLTLEVLTYHDLGVLSAGGALSLANQVARELLATLSGTGTLAATATRIGG